MSPDETEVVEGELLPAVYEPPSPPTLFGTSDPRLALQRMSDVATLLVDVIRDRGLVAKIRGREHLTAEAWTVLGSLVGVTPIVTWTRPLEDGAGWEARVEARTLDGRVVGAAESMCSRAESTWRSRDEFALRSMAQTRAIGRALRAPLSPIAKLAGYEPAGAEEMPADADSQPAPTEDHGKIPPEIRPTQDQVTRIRDLIAELTAAHPDTNWPESVREFAGVSGDMLTKTIADQVIRWLEKIATSPTDASAGVTPNP